MESVNDNHIVIPSIFIVGAPKCGTTALYQYLGSHPEIFMPSKKELYYFGSDLSFQVPRISKEIYLSYFKEASPDQKTGDATATNLRSESAASEIKNFNPEARIVIMLRNPVDMVYSLYSELKYNGNERTNTFEEALELAEKRRREKKVDHKITCPLEVLDYYRMGHYAEQIERYFEVFARDRIKILFYEEFREATKNSYLDILRFLEVTTDHQPDFEVVNPNKRTRNPSLQKFLKFLPDSVRQISRIAIPSKRVRGSLFESLKKWNTVYQNRPEMKQETRQHLTTYFQPEIEKLERLLDKDLSHWK